MQRREFQPRTRVGFREYNLPQKDVLAIALSAIPRLSKEASLPIKLDSNKTSLGTLAREQRGSNRLRYRRGGGRSRQTRIGQCGHLGRRNCQCKTGPLRVSSEITI